MEALPLATAVVVGGPVLALGGVTLLFLKNYINDQKRRSTSLTLPPGSSFSL